MYKKIAVTLLFSIILGTSYAQDVHSPQLIKYITTAPDGTTAITIFDDSRSNDMQLEAAHDFYKYELLDIQTKEPVYTKVNRGKRCSINKSNILTGRYKLRLFTKNFIISSTITILPIEKNNVAISD